jgi:hypothetical protein
MLLAFLKSLFTKSSPDDNRALRHEQRDLAAPTEERSLAAGAPPENDMANAQNLGRGVGKFIPHCDSCGNWHLKELNCDGSLVAAIPSEIYKWDVPFEFDDLKDMQR